MNSNTVGIIGHFGENNNFTDGQTVKTHNIYNELIKNIKNINILDTYFFKTNKIKMFMKSIKFFFKNKYLIIITSGKGTKFFVILYGLLNAFNKKKICYCTVGSYLDIYCKKNKLLYFFSKRLSKILTETMELKNNLDGMGFTNVETMYNFKQINEYKLNKYRIPNSFCIFSRIVKEKGIDDVAYAIKKMNSEKINCKLFIYGPINEDYRKEFDDLIKDNKYIQYCGIVPSNESSQVISKYFMLVFPTHYIKEGLPGTLIDAYFCGTPVIASDWHSAKEFVPDTVGYRYKFADRDALYEMMKYCCNNLEEVESKRKTAIMFSKKFTPKEAIKPLLNFIND